MWYQIIGTDLKTVMCTNLDILVIISFPPLHSMPPTEILLKVMLTTIQNRVRRGRDRMVVGFIATCAIISYHHQSCVIQSCPWRDVLDTTLCDKVYQ